mmetsp:Transcript_22745/g.37446  ORF Transcript_22745/g.37446 Transcript_22745/m.37446 type:complete len:203 (-) Transcript_22745:1371-1979(-)
MCSGAGRTAAFANDPSSCASRAPSSKSWLVRLTTSTSSSSTAAEAPLASSSPLKRAYASLRMVWFFFRNSLSNRVLETFFPFACPSSSSSSSLCTVSNICKVRSSATAPPPLVEFLSPRDFLSKSICFCSSFTLIAFLSFFADFKKRMRGGPGRPMASANSAMGMTSNLKTSLLRCRWIDRRYDIIDFCAKYFISGSRDTNS